MTASPRPPIITNVSIALNAVIAAIDVDRPKVLCVRTDDAFALPYGPFDPERHRTFEIGVREWVERQTDVSLGFIEQLYTFGDKGREAPIAALGGQNASDRIISVGYLALAPEPARVIADDAAWRDWYSFFPWEDWRGGEPAILAGHIIPALETWINEARDAKKRNRRLRVDTAFGRGGFAWEEERTLDRYELMYEAALLTEAGRHLGDVKEASAPSNVEAGLAMISDHRRILATAIGRLRGKLKYRPIIFEIMPAQFTLLQLQRTAEAIVGFEFHKQNFRRSVEKSDFVKPTGKTIQQTSGRPAALFEVNKAGLRDRAAGLAIPRKRLTPPHGMELLR